MCAPSGMAAERGHAVEAPARVCGEIAEIVGCVVTEAVCQIQRADGGSAVGESADTEGDLLFVGIEGSVRGTHIAVTVFVTSIPAQVEGLQRQEGNQYFARAILRRLFQDGDGGKRLRTVGQAEAIGRDGKGIRRPTGRVEPFVR